MIALYFLPLLLAPAALAGPCRNDGFHGHCSVNQSSIVVPKGLDALTRAPNLVLLGVGVQNYTCNANGTFTSVGALAQLFDISCMDGTAEFAKIQTDALGTFNALGNHNVLDGALVQAMQKQFNLSLTGTHYFQNGTNGGLEPIWDMRSVGPFAGNPNAIVGAHKTHSIASPDGPKNVNLLELAKDFGELANTVYRLNTVSGQPAPSCKRGDTSSVTYTSKYVLL